MRMDAAGRRVLEALVHDPDADATALAGATGLSEPVIKDRLERLHRQGILLGRSVRLDAGEVGFPYAALVLGRPTAQTTRAALHTIAGSAGVTRMFTLAAEHSIAFTLIGRDLADLQERASALAAAAGLQNLSVTLIVETMADDPAGGLQRAWTTDPLHA